jgi:hypothetical protein
MAPDSKEQSYPRMKEITDRILRKNLDQEIESG